MSLPHIESSSVFYLYVGHQYQYRGICVHVCSYIKVKLCRAVFSFRSCFSVFVNQVFIDKWVIGE